MIRDQYKDIIIKNCSHCGCDAISTKANDARSRLFYYIKCKGYKCGASIRAETKWEALERWNKRFDLGSVDDKGGNYT